jgi:hypothetical protein
MHIMNYEQENHIKMPAMLLPVTLDPVQYPIKNMQIKYRELLQLWQAIEAGSATPVVSHYKLLHFRVF